MTKDIEQLDEDIKTFKAKAKKTVQTQSEVKGYSLLLTILTDLLGCIFIGCAVGVFLQKMFGTSPLLTGGLTLLGGVAGLYTTIRFALLQEKKNK